MVDDLLFVDLERCHADVVVAIFVDSVVETETYFLGTKFDFENPTATHIDRRGLDVRVGDVRLVHDGSRLCIYN